MRPATVNLVRKIIYACFCKPDQEPVAGELTAFPVNGGHSTTDALINRHDIKLSSKYFYVYIHRLELLSALVRITSSFSGLRLMQRLIADQNSETVVSSYP